MGASVYPVSGYGDSQYDINILVWKVETILLSWKVETIENKLKKATH